MVFFTWSMPPMNSLVVDCRTTNSNTKYMYHNLNVFFWCSFMQNCVLFFFVLFLVVNTTYILY